MAKAKTPPKVEILLEIGLCGERTKEQDLIDYLETVADVVKKHPNSNKTVIEVPEIENIFGGPVTYFVIYQKLDGVKRVTKKDIRRAIKELVDPDDEMSPK